jgi:hypothetical protein
MKTTLLIGMMYFGLMGQNLCAQIPARPIEMTGYLLTPYDADLSIWTGSWQAPQCVYDRGLYQDNPDHWTQDASWEGTTWNNNYSGYGIFVVDLKEIRTINRFRVFQMFSDGKITGIKIFKNTTYTGSTAPLSSSGGWAEVTSGLTTIGAGLNNTSYISSPTNISTSDFSTRYIMLYCYNDGTLGSTSFIELKGIKAFYFDGSSYSINYMRSAPGATLPVQLLDYKAICQKNGTQLQWSTASEFSSDHFLIEKSNDAKAWHVIGKINAAGNSNQALAYEYFDKDLNTQTTYYRLKQIDFNGNYTYYQTSSEPCDAVPNCQFKIYPNPSKGQFTINGLEQNITSVAIYNAFGTVVWSQNITPNQKVEVDLSEYPNGVFYVNAQSSSHTSIQKISICK